VGGHLRGLRGERRMQCYRETYFDARIPACGHARGVDVAVPAATMTEQYAAPATQKRQNGVAKMMVRCKFTGMIDYGVYIE